jgi:L-cysteine desulfidase
MTVLRPESSGGLADAIERILDKGLVINADISVSVAGTELLGIKIRAALASFETAAQYGLDFPSGTNLNAAGWREADKIKAFCPECRNQKEEQLLIKEGCHICGWVGPLLIKAPTHMA